MEANFTSNPVSLLRLSARDVTFYKIPITAEDKRDALASFTGEQSLGPGVLPFELYIHMPNLLGEILRGIYRNWLNDRIPGSLS